ncbi:hypothetical protein CR513_19473, partial [Mucuna pruriens]
MLFKKERPKLQSEAEELETINLGEEEERREIRVGKQMPPNLRQKAKYIDVFASSYRNMTGLDTTIVEHRLPLIPNMIPIQQQLKRMKSEVALKIKEEVEKQWNAGFLAVAEYPQWVANIVLMPKKDWKV